MVARCGRDVCFWMLLHLAVKILVFPHFGGSKLEDLRPGYEISLYLTML